MSFQPIWIFAIISSIIGIIMALMSAIVVNVTISAMQGGIFSLPTKSIGIMAIQAELGQAIQYLFISCGCGVLGGIVQVVSTIFICFEKYKWYCWFQLPVFILCIAAYTLPWSGMNTRVRGSYFDGIDINTGSYIHFIVAIFYMTFVALNYVFILTFFGVVGFWVSNHYYKEGSLIYEDGY